MKSAIVAGGKLSTNGVTWGAAAEHTLILLSLLVGSIQLIFYGPEILMWVSMATLSVVGFSGLGRLLTVPAFATPWTIMAVSLSLGYGFGAFNTMARGYVSGVDLLNVTYAGHESLSRVLGGLLMLVAVLMCLGRLDKNKLIPSQRFTPEDQRVTFMVLLCTVVIVVLAVATGKLGFQASMGADEGSQLISPLGALAAAAMSPVLACSVFAFAAEKNSARRTLVLLLCLVLMAVLMVQGRRIFMYSTLLAVLAFFSARGAKNFFTLKTLLILVAVVLMILTTSKFYFAMRMAQWTAGPKPTLTVLVQDGFDIFMNAEKEGLDEKVEENQGTRTFILGYLGEVIEGVESHRAVGGDVLMLDLATAAPTLLWPGKWKIASQGSEEAVCHPIIGLPGWDAANTVVTAGACDFGWFGFFAYPVGLAALFALVGWACRGLPALVRLMFGFGIFDSLFNVENAISANFVQIRNLMLIGSVALVLVAVSQWFGRLPSQRRKRERIATKAGAAEQSAAAN
jgi:hypothetical protein